MQPKHKRGTNLPAAAAPGLDAEVLQKGALHQLDYEDVALTVAGTRLVRQAAAAVLRQFMSLAGELSLAHCLALFLDQVFWDEKSGGLILCADFPGKSFCLPIPRECWSLLPHGGRLQ